MKRSLLTLMVLLFVFVGVSIGGGQSNVNGILPGPRPVIIASRTVGIQKNGELRLRGAPHFHYHADICAPGAPSPGFQNHSCGSTHHWVGERTADNTVTRVGCKALIDQVFTGPRSANWYVGEIVTGAGTTIVTTDTMGAHAGWTQQAVGDLSNATLPGLTLAAANAGADVVTTDNSASKAVFTQNSTTSVLGFYVEDGNAKNDAAGILYGAASFTSAPVAAGYTLNVTVTMTATAS